MKKYRRIFIAIASVVICQATMAQKKTTITKTAYTIQCPAGWTIDSSKQMGTDLVFFSMLENTADQFRENVNVLIQNIAGKNINLARYTAISTGQIQTLAANSHIESSNTIKSANKTYQKIIYTASQGGSALKFEQYYFVTTEKAYVVTFTTEANKFEVYKQVGEAALNSFVLR